MTGELPSRKEALIFLRDSGCSERVVRHCKAVAKLADEISRQLEKKGVKVNRELVEAGAILHDIGRSRTHSVHHAVEGAQIAEALGLPEAILSIIKRHVGSGITAGEARHLGWPEDIYTPQTIEEKIVSYADKLIEGSRRISIERVTERLRLEKLPPLTVKRMRELHREMASLIGDPKWQP